MSLQVVISRESGDLTLSGDAVSPGLWVSGAVNRPGRVWRRNRVQSEWLHGAPQSSAVLEVSEVAMTVAATAASAGALEALRQMLDSALFQWAYTLTITEDGVTTAYSADCADVTWQPFDAGHARALVSLATVTIPVHPIPTPGGP